MRKHNLKNIEKTLSALAEPSRLRCLYLLASRKLAVCEIREILGLSFSTVSKHLSVLQEAGLIENEKEGKWVHYHLAENIDPEIKSLLDNVQALASEDPVIKNDLKMARTVDKNKICSLKTYLKKSNSKFKEE